MSQVLSAKQVCERALRAIGAFPVTDSAADGEQLREAMTWLDLILAENAGTNKLLFLVPSPNTVQFPITNGTANYDLIEALGADAPVDGVQFPIAAYLIWPSGHRKPIPLVTRDVFMAPHDPAETGPPRMVYVDRLPDSQLYIWPAPAVEDPETYTLVLDVQTYAPNVAPAGVTGKQPQSEILTNFRQAWQRYLVAQLSHDLGTGPIFKIGEASLNRFGKMAGDAKDRLEAFENREHDDLAPICQAYDADMDWHQGHHRHHGVDY